MKRNRRNLKKREGSTLVVALMIFTVLFIVGASVMSMVTMAVKVQGVGQKQTQALYGAESGITFVQAALEKTFETATLVAQETAESDETFQQLIVNFIGQDPENKFTESAKQLAYWSDADTLVSVLPPTRASNISLEILDAHQYDVENKKWLFGVQSTFTDQSQIERVVQVDIEITIPPWSPAPNDKEPNPEVEVPLEPLLIRNSLTIGGNLYIENNNVNVQNNVFVAGRPSDELDSVQDKYEGGIYNNQPSGGNLVFPDGRVVATGQTFHANGNTTSGLKSANIYAQNILITESADFEARAGILDNDLVVTATDSNIIFDNYYGINDVTIDRPSLYRDSSSILINTPDPSKIRLNISTSAYISGTAMIDLAKPYQTGESVAVQGNYLVYTLPIEELTTLCNNPQTTTEIGKCSELVYEYRQPLQVLTGVQKLDGFQEWTIAQKAKYFREVANTVTKAQELLNYSASVNVARWNSFAAGALLYTENNQVKVKIPEADTSAKITAMQADQQPEYARQVYRLGYTAAEGLPVTAAEEKAYLQAVYDQYGEDAWGIHNIIDFSNGEPVSPENIGSYEDAINENLLYNPDPNKTVHVIDGDQACPPTTEAVCLKMFDRWEDRLIITAGDVIFHTNKGYVFSGAVIAAGDMTITGTGAVRIQLHQNMAELIAKYGGDKLAGVFLPVEKPETASLLVTNNEEEKPTEFGYYSPQEAVIFKRWQLVR
ncbi:MAG: pilus assembly PilX N-terminal domain-containing protein [Culicoidibacterales bacterium]